MKTQMQLEVSLAGTRIATGVRDNKRDNEDENGKRLFLLEEQH